MLFIVPKWDDVDGEVMTMYQTCFQIKSSEWSTDDLPRPNAILEQFAPTLILKNNSYLQFDIGQNIQHLFKQKTHAVRN